MASRGQSIVVTYVAWDTAAKAGATGDVANHTLRVVKDGTSAAATNSPSEVDSANAPGVYKLTLTASECTADCVTVAGKSSTSGVVIAPVTVTFEQLPTAAPGATNGLPQVGVAPLTHLTGDAYARLGAPAGASVSADLAAVKAETAAILDDTGTSGVVLTSSERNSVAAALLALSDGVETGVTVKQALRLIAAAVGGVLSGAATATVTIKAAANSGTTRVTATVDESGNRSALTLNL